MAVTNTDGDPEGLIKHGNERVLRARFNDARFFWDADQRRKLSERVQDLANVTFQAKLGSYLEKTERVTELVLTLQEYANRPGETLSENDLKDAKIRYAFNPDSEEFHSVRAARLAKADLTTELVKEFTELQGVIGGLYARAQGEPEGVATAIYDHYKPVSMEDSIPATQAGQLLAVADKLDTLQGCFRVGLIPTGSKDPFALRRAGQGIVKILVEGKLRLPIRTLLGSDAQLQDFFVDRVRNYFREIRGFGYDEVNAVLASVWDDLVDLEERLLAIREIRPTENFEPVAAAFKRIKNILRQGDAKPSPPHRGIAAGAGRGVESLWLLCCQSCRRSAEPRRLQQQALLHRGSSPRNRPLFRQSSGERARPGRSSKSAHAASHHAGRVLNHCGFFRNRDFFSGD